jgi:hypothetical protein
MLGSLEARALVSPPYNNDNNNNELYLNERRYYKTSSAKRILHWALQWRVCNFTLSDWTLV